MKGTLPIPTKRLYHHYQTPNSKDAASPVIPSNPTPLIPQHLHRHVRFDGKRRFHMILTDDTPHVTPGVVVHWKTVSTSQRPRRRFTPMTVTRVASITPFTDHTGTPLRDGWLGITIYPDGTEASENTHGLAVATTISDYHRGQLMAWVAPLAPSPELWDWFNERLSQ